MPTMTFWTFCACLTAEILVNLPRINWPSRQTSSDEKSAPFSHFQTAFLGCNTEPTAEDQDMAHWLCSIVQVEYRRNASPFVVADAHAFFPHIHLQEPTARCCPQRMMPTCEQTTVGPTIHVSLFWRFLECLLRLYSIGCCADSAGGGLHGPHLLRWLLVAMLDGGFQVSKDPWRRSQRPSASILCSRRRGACGNITRFGDCHLIPLGVLGLRLEEC